MGVCALAPAGSNRWMAPEGVRLIPTLYQRGSKNGLKRLSGALQIFARKAAPAYASGGFGAVGAFGASSAARKRMLLAAILPLRSIPSS
jgi:hypothetical protein